MPIKKLPARGKLRIASKPSSSGIGGNRTLKKPLAQQGKKRAIKKDGAFARLGSEKRKQELQNNKPWSVKVPVGGTLDVYLLDAEEPFATYEHSIRRGNGRWDTVPCIQDGPEPCPICLSEGKQGSYTMYLTAVIPLEKYTKQSGERVTRRYQKKLFPIKVGMGAKYQRTFEKYGTFRGLKLRLIRDTAKSPGTGNDFEVIGQFTEMQLKAIASGRKAPDNETRDNIIKSKLLEPFDYEKIFPAVSAKELAAMAGVAASGAKGAGGGMLGDEDFEESDDGFGGDHGWGEDD